jgi:hypothetical protein
MPVRSALFLRPGRVVKQLRGIEPPNIGDGFRTAIDRIVIREAARPASGNAAEEAEPADSRWSRPAPQPNAFGFPARAHRALTAQSGLSPLCTGESMTRKPLLASLVAALLAGCAQDAPSGPGLTAGDPVLSRGQSAAVNQQLAAVRQATIRFKQMTQEELAAEGYVNTQVCVPGMGIHFVKFGAIDGTVDPLHPEVLVFEPKPHGRLQLVAVEYFALGATSPTVFDRGMDQSHLPFTDWELHAWVWKGNPEGMFNPTNPNVSCP